MKLMDGQHEINFREKRLNIVFKLIYVLAIFVAFLFLQIGEQFGKGLSDVYIVEVELITFLICSLLSMIVYVFRELKYFAFKERKDLEFDEVEKSYLRIFNDFGFLVLVLFIFALVTFFCRKFFTYKVFSVCLVVFSFFVVLGFLLSKCVSKIFRTKIFYYVRLFFNVLFINCSFLFLAFVKV